jgi:hypothetical protein
MLQPLVCVLSYAKLFFVAFGVLNTKYQEQVVL